MFLVTKDFKSVADRWMYPSMPFISLIPVYLSFKYLPWRKVSVGFVVAIILYFGISSYSMNRVFKDDLSYWEQAAKYGTDAVGYNSLAKAYDGKNDERAEFYYKKSLEQTPRYYLSWINYGTWRIKRGDFEDGLALVEKGVENAHLYMPTHEARARYLYSKALKETGKPIKAYEEARKAVNLEKNVEYLYEAALQAQSDTIGRWDESIVFLESIHGEIPNYKSSRFLAGFAYQKNEELDRAIEEYDLAIQYTPAISKSYFNIGYILASKQEYEKAIIYFEKYLEFAPESDDAKGNILFCKNRLQAINEE